MGRIHEEKTVETHELLRKVGIWSPDSEATVRLDLDTESSC